MRSIRYLFISLTLFLVSACAVNEPDENWATAGHLVGDPDKDGRKGFFKEYKLAYDTDSKPNATQANKAATSRRYLVRGVNLTRTTCFDFLDRIARDANHTEYAKNQLLITSVLATGVLGIFGFGPSAFEAVALGTAFATSSADLYRDHYLLGPDADVIVDLVKRSMETAEKTIDQTNPQSFDQAYGILQSYSELCTFETIRRLVRESIKSANIQVDYTATLSQQIELSIRQELATILGVSAISEPELTGIYWKLVNPIKKPDQTEIDQTKYTQLVGNLKDKIKDAKKQVAAKKVLAKLPMSSRNRLDQIIIDLLQLTEAERQAMGVFGYKDGNQEKKSSISGGGLGRIRVEIK